MTVKLSVAACCATMLSTGIALADDNCGQVKNELAARFDTVHWGNCFHPLPPTADAEGALVCAKVVGDGALPKESGHRTVANWKYILGVRFPLPNTYLGYCGGDKIGGAKLLESGTPRPNEDEMRKEIQRELDRMRSEYEKGMPR